MRAVVCKAWCGPEALTVEDIPAPTLEAGGVRIRVHTAGLNFADNLIIAGRYQIKPQLPFSPGFASNMMQQQQSAADGMIRKEQRLNKLLDCHVTQW